MKDYFFSPRRHGDTEQTPRGKFFSPCLRASVVKSTKKTSPWKFLLVLFTLFSITACQESSYREGARLYKTNCANCHMDDGVGLGALIPPLAGADYLKNHRDKLPCILKYGMKDSILVNGQLYAEAMPGVPTLSAIHVTNILNYINHSWGNDNPVYRLDEVQELLKGCE